jgi:hypothetical protein
MTQNNRPQPVKGRTPKGTFKWPKITEPDYGTKDYPKPDGEYSVKVVFSAADPEHQRFRARMEKAAEIGYATGRAEFAKLKPAMQKKLKDVTEQPVFEDIVDEDGNETGEFEMKVKVKASGERKKGPKAGTRWTRKVPIFDAKGQQIKKSIDVWGGTTGKVSFTYMPEGYFIPATGLCGIALKLEAVQIIDLVQGGARSASEYGFEEEEGFSAEAEDAPKGPSADDLGGDDYGTDEDPGF